MKAVVLARGLGTRMRAQDLQVPLDERQSAVADRGVKSLVPLGKGPLLDHVLAELCEAGCSEICLVVGPEPDVVRTRYTSIVPPRRFRVAFAVQERPLGTGNALLAAEAFTQGEEFLMTNSDNYYPPDVLRTLAEMGRPGTVLFSPQGLLEHSNIEPERIVAFALGRIGADGCLDQLIEKPDDADLRALGPERHVSMNCWRFSAAIFDACRELKPSARGELELADAITNTIGKGVRYLVRTSAQGVLDLTRRADIPFVEERLRDIEVCL